jgi:pilus assembly protein CpaC
VQHIRPDAVALMALITAASSLAATRQALPPGATMAQVLKPCESVTVDPTTYLALGKSQVIRLPMPAARIIVGGGNASRGGGGGRPPAPAAAPMGGAGAAPSSGPQSGSDGVAETEVTLLSPTELFFTGRRAGSMNVVLQSADGRCLVKDLVVTIDPGTLQAKLGELMPEESGIKVRGAENALVLTGSVSDAIKLDQVMSVAGSYGDGQRVVNLLRINTPQQVMLEVKIAEVSKTLLDKFGLDFSRLVTNASGLTSSIISGIVGGGAGLLGQFTSQYPFGAIGGNASSTVSGGSATSNAFVGSTDTTVVQNPDGTFSRKITLTPGAVGKSATLLSADMQKKDGVLRVLAEPNIMAISGQSASFLSGGKIFIPVAQNNGGVGGGSTITLEEKEFGVGLKFTPTVLDGTRINLKLVSEVSELQQTGSPFFTVGGATAILPSMSTRRVDTTVQLNDGQSFAVAGLIGNNMNEALTKFPGLGEVPVMGALFRSTEFQTNQTELMFVVTPRLVKPLTAPVALPTDNHVVPSRADVILMGSGEGKPAAPVAAPKP